MSMKPKTVELVPLYICACGYGTSLREDAKKHWEENEYHFWLVFDGNTPRMSSLIMSLEVVGDYLPKFKAELEGALKDLREKKALMSKEEVLNLARKEWIDHEIEE